MREKEKRKEKRTFNITLHVFLGRQGEKKAPYF